VQFRPEVLDKVTGNKVDCKHGNISEMVKERQRWLHWNTTKKSYTAYPTTMTSRSLSMFETTNINDTWHHFSRPSPTFKVICLLDSILNEIYRTSVQQMMSHAAQSAIAELLLKMQKCIMNTRSKLLRYYIVSARSKCQCFYEGTSVYYCCITAVLNNKTCNHFEAFALVHLFLMLLITL